MNTCHFSELKLFRILYGKKKLFFLFAKKNYFFLLMTEKYELHVDKSTMTELRGKIFGHDGAIITFTEGLIAKQCKFMEEVRFYSMYLEDLYKQLPPSLVPEVLGICAQDGIKINDTQDIYSFEVKKKIEPDLYTGKPFLIMRDIAQGYKKPAVLDLKVGIRTWPLGASEIKKTRMRRRCLATTTNSLGLRVRAAMWYSANTDKWSEEGDTNYINRLWGNHCTDEELQEFFIDFFHYTEHIPVLIEKLKMLYNSIDSLRKNQGIRMFSSSVLFAYDEEDRSKFDCRLLDFAKTYFDIDDQAPKHNESVEDCEDQLLPSIANVITLLERVPHDSSSTKLENTQTTKLPEESQQTPHSGEGIDLEAQ